MGSFTLNPQQQKAVDTTEGALLLWLHDKGINYLTIRENVAIIERLPFSTENKYMATVVNSAVLDKKISTGAAQFCIVMVDVNYLKRVNDNYGHECGNLYLMNACRLVCAVFGEENVYRVGGDEFVVVIEGEKSTLIKYFTAQFKLEMGRKTANESLKPWERISAAIGTATFESTDKTAEEVFKRADAQMYENKLAMKANRTD